MPAIGLNMSDRDPVKGWADVRPTLHPINPLVTLALAAWKLADQMIDNGEDINKIIRMQEIAQELENLAEEKNG